VHFNVTEHPTALKELLTLKAVTRQSNEFSCKELLRVR
jgi:hypothetical protein